MAFTGHPRETEAQKTARLAESPPSSKNHWLSTRPITIREPSMIGLVIRLGFDVVVVPNCQVTGSIYHCTIVASNNSSYPVGGYDITVSRDELERGERVYGIPVQGSITRDYQAYREGLE